MTDYAALRARAVELGDWALVREIDQQSGYTPEPEMETAVPARKERAVPAKKRR